MNPRKYISVLVFSLCFLGCKPSEDRRCFKGMGEIILEHRDLELFRTVILDDHIDLILTEDPEDYAVIETGSNLANLIETSISGDTLTILDNNRCAFLRDLDYKTTVHLHTSSLDRVMMGGSGDLSATGAITRNITLNCLEANGGINLTLNNDTSSFFIEAGVTDVHLTGNSEYSYFYYFGNGNVDASNLVNTNTVINWSSTGWLKIFTSNALSGSINSYGNVYYSGNPANVNVGLNGEGLLVGE